MKKLTVEQTSRPDGIGRPVYGWYVMHFGVAVGCARATRDEAMADMHRYVADLRAGIAS